MKKLSTLILSLCILSVTLVPSLLNAGPASGKRINGKELREGMIGQPKAQVIKWFGTPDRTNGKYWTSEGLTIYDPDSGTTQNVMSVVFDAEEGGTVQSVQFLKSY